MCVHTFATICASLCVCERESELSVCMWTGFDNCALFISQFLFLPTAVLDLVTAITAGVV